MDEAPKKGSGLAVAALCVSVVSVLISLGIGGGGLLWSMAEGQSGALTTVLSICSDYRAEVADLADRGLNERQIVRLFAMEDLREWDTLSGEPLGKNGYELRQGCGSVGEVLALLERSRP